MSTHREGVDEQGNQNKEKKEQDDGDYKAAIVLPDDVLEGLPRRCEPQERSLWAAGGDTREEDVYKKMGY